MPTVAESTFVAFESFTYSTPPRSATSSSRWGTPANVRSASRTASPPIPRASAAAAAAIAFSWLCAPRSRMPETGSSASPRQLSIPPASSTSDPGGPNETRRACPGRSPPRTSSSGATATSSGPWLAKARSFAALYASTVPCRSRWSSRRLRRTAASGANASLSSSWKLDASQTTVVVGGSSPTSVASGVPTLPATATGSPAARRIAPTNPAGAAASRSLDRLLVQREPDRRADRGHDPEAQDDLRLRPRHQLEVVVHGSHQEHPSSEALEREHLDRHRERLDHEDPADDEEQHLGLGHHRHRRDGAAEPERSGVAHENRRWERVEPQEAHAGPDQAGAEQRQLLDLRAARAERHRGVGQQHDRRAARGQPVEAVGEVHAVARTREHQEDQERIDVAEVQVRVEEAHVEVVLQADAARGHVPEPHRDHRLQQELLARGQAE